MKLKLAIALLAMSSFAFAQHGHSGGPPAGAGPGMGSSANTSQGMASSTGMEHGQPAETGRPSMANSGKTPSAILSQNTHLSSNLEKLLPSGMSAQDACSGFSHLGQCVAAIHVSNNLGIPFSDLKAKVTGSGSESLGKAIEQLKPSANAKAENKKAQKQANADLNGNS